MVVVTDRTCIEETPNWSTFDRQKNVWVSYLQEKIGTPSIAARS